MNNIMVLIKTKEIYLMIKLIIFLPGRKKENTQCNTPEFNTLNGMKKATHFASAFVIPNKNVRI